MIRKPHQHSRGVTLVEMLLVVVILGVATIYSMTFIRAKQRENEIKNTAQQLKNILQLAQEYHSRFDVWPDSAESLQQNMGVNALDFCTSWPGTGSSVCPNNAIIEITPETSSNQIKQQVGSEYGILNTISEDDRLVANFKVSLTLTAPGNNVQTYQNLVKSIAYYLPTSLVSDNATKITLYTSARILLQPPEYTYGYITHSGFGRTNGTIPLAEQCHKYQDSSGKYIEMEKHAHIAMMYGVTDNKRWWDNKGLFGLFGKEQKDAQLVLYLQSQASDCTKRGDCYINFSDGSTITNSSNFDWKRQWIWDKSDDNILTAESQSNRKSTGRYIVFYYLSMCLPSKMWQASADDGFGATLFKPSQRAGAKLILNDYGVGQCGGGGWMCASNNGNIYDMLNL